MSTISATTISASAILRKTQKLRVSDGEMMSIFSDDQSFNYTLIVILPQLGDFDSLEYAWWLNQEADLLKTKKINVNAVGIGNRESGKKFCQYTGFSEDHLFLDFEAKIHRELNLYQGLKWNVSFFSVTQNAWLNLLLMCAGIGSKGTLKEVFRGYTGDKNATPLFGENESINIKPLPVIKGSLFNRVGKNYQRPFELATLRLQNMVEVLKHWGTYVPDDQYITQRGGSFLFNKKGELIYEYRDKGILGFAENMSNPLAFLQKLT
jgi:hypothetical protein